MEKYGPLRSWKSFQENSNRPPLLELIPTEEDLDATKQDALNKLFNQMDKFNKAMANAGIEQTIRDRHDSVAGYSLTDSEFAEPYEIEIQFPSALLNTDEFTCISPQRDIFFRVVHDFHYTSEIRNELIINFRYSDDNPFHWLSGWSYSLFNSSYSYFNGLDIEEGSAPGYDFVFMSNQALNYKTIHFHKAVDYLCLATDRLIERVQFLSAKKESE